MKNFVFCVMMGAAITASITSCSKEGNEQGKNNEGIAEAVVIHTNVETKATDSSWDTDDAIGVTMYYPDYSAIYDNQFNREYITNVTLGVFFPFNFDETLYYPLDGSDMVLKAYYPYMDNLPQNMIVHWTVDNQESLQAIDLMTAEHVSGFNKDATTVRLHFYHRLCKLVFLLQTEEETAGVSLPDCQLTITGMETGNDYDLFNDVYGTNYDGIADIQVPLRSNEVSNVRMAIVLPRDAGEGVTFEFETPEGAVYTAVMSDGLELVGGNKYTFLITLAENPTLVTATIEPWIENDFQYLIAH